MKSPIFRGGSQWLIFHHFCLIHKIQNSVQIETFCDNICLILAIIVPVGPNKPKIIEFWCRFCNSKLPAIAAIWDRNVKNPTLWQKRKLLKRYKVELAVAKHYCVLLLLFVSPLNKGIFQFSQCRNSRSKHYCTNSAKLVCELLLTVVRILCWPFRLR